MLSTYLFKVTLTMKKLFIAVLLLPSRTKATEDGGNLKDLIVKFGDLASEFAQRVEDLYHDRRCNSTDLEACFEANYNGCTSTFYCSFCNNSTELIIEDCANRASILDVTVSSVLLPSRKLANADGTSSLSKQVSTSNI